MPGYSDPGDNGSLKQQLVSTTRTFLGHFQARAQLFVLEAYEASRILGTRAAHLAIGGSLLLLGYVLFVVAFIPLIADSLSIPWEFVCLVAAGLHVLAGGLLLRFAKEVFSKPMFESTLNELEKDREWLHQKAPSNDRKRN